MIVLGGHLKNMGTVVVLPACQKKQVIIVIVGKINNMVE